MDRKPLRILVAVVLALSAGLAVAVATDIWSFSHIDNNDGMSNSSVNVIFQDRNDILWVGTWDGLNRYDGNRIVQYRAISRDTTTLSNPVVRDIVEEDDTYLWVVTDRGLNRLDRRTGVFRRYYLDEDIRGSGYVEKSFHCTSNGDGLVVACRDGGQLLWFDKSSHTFSPMPMSPGPQESIRQLCFSDKSHLTLVTDHWICQYDLGTSRRARLVRRRRSPGTIFFDQQGEAFVQMGREVCLLDRAFHLQHTGIFIDGMLTAVSQKGTQTAIATNNGYYLVKHQGLATHYMEGTVVTALCHGTQDILWAGTDGKGLYQFYDKTNSILTYRIGLHESAVRAILRIGSRLLVGTKGEGLFVYQQDQQDSLHLQQNLNVGPGRTHNAVFALTPSLNKARVWVGTDGEGLSFYADGGLHRMDLSRVSSGEAGQLRSVYSIVQSDDSTLFLGTSGHGVVRVRFTQNSITGVLSVSKLLPKNAAADIVYTQVLDGPYLWFGARESGLFRLDTRTLRCKHFSSGSAPHGLISNDVISLYKAADGRLWVGTSQGLCFMEDVRGAGRFQWISDKAPESIMNVHNIQEDAAHNIWVSTSDGLFLVMKNLSTVHLTYRDGLQGNEFADGAGSASAGGHILYFGGTKGLSSIAVGQMRGGGTIPPLSLYEITIDGRRADAGGDIRLGVKARSICFSFSVPDYLHNDRCQIVYSLTRQTLFSTDEQPHWQMGSPDKSVTLNELPPGDYLLRVRQSNYSQQWSARCLEIPFHVDYPIWLRWWAILAYFLLFTIAVRAIYLYKKRRLIRMHQRELEKQDERTREDIHRAKLRFFSSVTRAFSNNITQIFDALSHIRKNPTGEIAPDLSIIDQNVRLMSTHIRQISEIRSTEENLPLTPMVINLYDVVVASLENYVSRMLKAGILANADEAMREVEVVTDRPILMKVFSYLLEYIFQNIASDSPLTIKAREVDNTVRMTFAYQGQAPNEEEMTEIFNTHKAVDQLEKDQTGVGRIIGVTISNSLLKRLGGGLTIVTHGEESRQIEFQLTLAQMPLPAPPKPQDGTVVERIMQQKDKRVGLVGCSAAMADFARRALGEHYDWIAVSPDDVMAGSLAALKTDLIVCELSDDNRFITRLRTDPLTKFIPIIGVCDEGERESFAGVLAMGVNTILERPFTTQYFITVVDHAVLDTQRMRDFSQSAMAYAQRFDCLGLNEKDKKFIYQAVDILRQHFSDDGYTPDQLARDLTVSRSQLYRKMRELTKISPGDFILEYRLVHAEMLLKTTDMTVSEIINACGFRNRSFFYREFSLRNHCLPLEFRRRDG